ncbi:MAG TPA: hypothetical protein VN822_13030 [Candidatus Acidoferrales bacterium]|nr:hypothetical protein [Candidatus Acidoferrales bacterium]
MHNHDSIQKGTVASGKGTPLTNAGRDSAECSKTDSGPADGKGSSRPEASPIAAPGQAPGPLTEQERRPPISARKLAANRRNAKRSTGPKTPQGKENSSRNSYKLGIFARQIFRRTEEGLKEWEGYKDTVARIYDHYRPQNVMEELLVDKVVTESVRFARLLWLEHQEFSRKDALWGQTSDKLLRGQTAINRQLTKAIEQLKDLQAERKAASGESEPSYGPELDGVAGEPCDVPEGLVPGDEDHLTSAASGNGPGARREPVELAGEAIAAQPLAPAPGEVSCGGAEISNSGPQTTENCKTNPPSSSSGGGNDDTVHEQAGQTQPLAEIIERAAGPAAPQEPNNRLVPTSDFGTKSQDATPREPGEEDILNCL